MSEKLLLISSAKSGVLLEAQQPRSGWFIAMVVVGLLVFVVGMADLSSRLAHKFFGSNASAISFAPAVALMGPSTAITPSAPALTSSTSTSAFIPARLQIPSIGVDAKVEQVGKKADGSMGTPNKFEDVAWYAPGSSPGEPGNTVIDGHVNNALTTAGVFEHLSSVDLGDTIKVTDASGRSIIYMVSQVQQYGADTAPADAIFATTGPTQLVLITCDGDWIQSEHSFDKRLVVFARPI